MLTQSTRVTTLQSWSVDVSLLTRLCACDHGCACSGRPKLLAVLYAALDRRGANCQL